MKGMGQLVGFGFKINLELLLLYIYIYIEFASFSLLVILQYIGPIPLLLDDWDVNIGPIRRSCFLFSSSFFYVNIGSIYIWIRLIS